MCVRGLHIYFWGMYKYHSGGMRTVQTTSEVVEYADPTTYHRRSCRRPSGFLVLRTLGNLGQDRANRRPLLLF